MIVFGAFDSALVLGGGWVAMTVWRVFQIFISCESPTGADADSHLLL